jgi:hypothetical protein
MYLTIKNGIRGGHSFIAERICKVREHDDEDQPEDFISQQHQTDLLYIDW